MTPPPPPDAPGPRHFGLATWAAPPSAELHDRAALLGKATLWLVDHRLPDGTWGGLDPLERFDTTLQVVQTLLMVGIAPDSEILTPTLQYLVSTELKLPITFWRAGALLNIPAYTDTVVADLTFAWNEPRLGVIGYPPALFLLKCVRFMHDPSRLPFTVTDAVGRAVADWKPDRCWENRASLTSLGMTQVYNVDFPDRAAVLPRCREFLLDRAKQEAASRRHGFAENLVDDCYVVINVCETPAAFAAEPEIAAVIKGRVDALWTEQAAGGFWFSEPPFEGTTSGGGIVHPTAIAVRALASYYSLTDPGFVSAIAANLLERCAMEAWTRRRLYPLAEELGSVRADDGAGEELRAGAPGARGASGALGALGPAGAAEAPVVGSA